MTNENHVRPTSPVACVIWLHGLGADGGDMAGLAQELVLRESVHHVFMDAPVRPVTLNNHLPMRAWYDILGMNLTDREDKVGIMQSEAEMLAVIAEQKHAGFSSQQIFLAGFSQGGAMALHTGLRLAEPIGGIVGLSTYLPLAAECTPNLARSTPIFIAGGKFDPIVQPAWTRLTVDWLRGQQFEQLTYSEYAMEHAVCREELNDLSAWFNEHLQNCVNPAKEK